MRQVDTSVVEEAKGLLSFIDYGTLINAPFDSVVNVTFLYIYEGRQIYLVVLSLVIVPIPLITVDEVDVQVKENINALPLQSTEQGSQSQVGGELISSGKIGWSPFSPNASYSTKQNSKATQDSRCSVEYTQNVQVHATQAELPAGLTTALYILSSANVRIDGIPDWLSFDLSSLGQTISGEKASRLRYRRMTKDKSISYYRFPNRTKKKLVDCNLFNSIFQPILIKSLRLVHSLFELMGLYLHPSSQASIKADSTSMMLPLVKRLQ
ncbi:hypothetical protein BTJ40_06935 [Microbulbifer sp. A4B17]|uniref:hypothetical protein n=1 Tax=Microbulbifer sp. A4B17 TaxID=359370 RepID=UPI000D52B846|nr:hypothetical protein [Microbulbifer sp. A4B17]AWF80563.1 hypothetical protein BTJ40_06935 [Microbulbifer sp. A4B17]